LSYKKEGYMK